MVEVIRKQDCPDQEGVPGAFLHTEPRRVDLESCALLPQPPLGFLGQWFALSVVLRCSIGLKPLFHRCHN